MNIGMEHNTDTQAASLGAYIRDRRTELGLRQEDLASKINLTQRTISDIENGRNKGQNYATLEAIADALGLEYWRLIVLADLAKDRRDALKAIEAERAHREPPSHTFAELRAQAHALIDKMPDRHIRIVVDTLEVMSQSRRR